GPPLRRQDVWEVGWMSVFLRLVGGRDRRFSPSCRPINAADEDPCVGLPLYAARPKRLSSSARTDDDTGPIQSARRQVLCDLHAKINVHHMTLFAKFLQTIQGTRGVHLSERQGTGIAWVEGSEFGQGTIELDVRGRDVFQHSFVGVAFHRRDDSTSNVGATLRLAQSAGPGKLDSRGDRDGWNSHLAAVETQLGAVGQHHPL